MLGMINLRKVGRATCRLLGERGAFVLVADRDLENAQATARAVNETGGQAEAYRIDFASIPDMGKTMRRIASDHGRLNILFSNVGTRCASGFEVSESDFNEAISINLKNHFFLTNLATPMLKAAAPKASIIYMGSGAGLRYFGRSPLYSISKAGLLMMMRTFSHQLAGEGIRVNAVCPGPIETAFPLAGMTEEQQKMAIDKLAGQVPLGRIGQPDDVARVVAFLASSEAGYLTGLTVPVDGGAMA